MRLNRQDTENAKVRGVFWFLADRIYCEKRAIRFCLFQEKDLKLLSSWSNAAVSAGLNTPLTLAFFASWRFYRISTEIRATDTPWGRISSATGVILRL
jgi:hypothetical protein